MRIRTVLSSLIAGILSAGTATIAPAQTGAELIASNEKGWPQFRGPRRDGTSAEKNLLRSWPVNGPRLIWSAEKLGRGYSSPIIANGRIYITGDVGDELQIFALNTEGQLAWKRRNGASWKDPYPGARASVTYSDGRIYHENAHGRLACLDANDGREIWAVSLLEQFGGENITWGLSECLLVDDRAVYATAGGSAALVVALDKKNGALLWKSAPLRDEEGEQKIENPGYVSPILVRFADRRLLIGCSLKYLFCADADTGKLQWTRRFPTTYSVIAMMPALVDNAIFMTAPHGKGGRLLQLVPPTGRDDPVTIQERWQTRLDTLQGGVVRIGNKLIGSYYPGRKGWAAIDVDTGDVLYENSRFVKGAMLYADERLYTLSEDGWMRLLEPGANEFSEHGQFRLSEASHDAWAHPVIYEGRLYLRYHEMLRCYDVRRSL